MQFDIVFQGHGEITMLMPGTEHGLQVMQTYIESEPYQWHGAALMVETACVPEILAVISPVAQVDHRTVSGVMVRTRRTKRPSKAV